MKNKKLKKVDIINPRQSDLRSKKNALRGGKIIFSDIFSYRHPQKEFGKSEKVSGISGPKIVFAKGKDYRRWLRG